VRTAGLRAGSPVRLRALADRGIAQRGHGALGAAGGRTCRWPVAKHRRRQPQQGALGEVHVTPTLAVVEVVEASQVSVEADRT
jgi:hypothetical protein